MFEFSTIEQALEDLRQGKIILVRMIPIAKTKEILSVRRNLPLQKMSTSWRYMERDLFACQ